MPAAKPAPPRKPRVPFSPDVARRICAALAAGQGLRRLTRRPGMPTRATIMRWLREDPDFAAHVFVARFDGGLGIDGLGPGGRRGLPSGFTPALADEIYDRLSAGEPLRAICRSPHMPSRSTVHNWARAEPQFAQDIALARENAAWTEADRRLTALGFTSYEAFAKAPLPAPQAPRRPKKPEPPP